MQTEQQYKPNQFSRLLARFARAPEPVRNRLVGLAFGRYSPYFRHNKIRVRHISEQKVTLALANHAGVRNHLGGIHAVAITLAAEYASGLLVGQHNPDSSVVVVKSMHVDLHKKIHGAIEATARLSADQIKDIRTLPKGTLSVPFSVVDESGAEPINGVMEMAWIPKKPKTGRTVK